MTPTIAQQLKVRCLKTRTTMGTAGELHTPQAQTLLISTSSMCIIPVDSFLPLFLPTQTLRQEDGCTASKQRTVKSQGCPRLGRQDEQRDREGHFGDMAVRAGDRTTRTARRRTWDDSEYGEDGLGRQEPSRYISSSRLGRQDGGQLGQDEHEEGHLRFGAPGSRSATSLGRLGRPVRRDEDLGRPRQTIIGIWARRAKSQGCPPVRKDQRPQSLKDGKGTDLQVLHDNRDGRRFGKRTDVRRRNEGQSRVGAVDGDQDPPPTEAAGSAR
ncbi:hypothetical protein A4X13_0g1018 [Tilletia indica]|uniref:Uncharacterized protein n=1 Tax=Tilletia indica TaxID=43049 RepID=A0A8T8TEP4_9BASI|nr:hypothetical protein A4X13_0g1018 [Tilletia indica]